MMYLNKNMPLHVEAGVTIKTRIVNATLQFLKINQQNPLFSSLNER